MALLMDTTLRFWAMTRESLTKSISFWQKAGFSRAKSHRDCPPTRWAQTVRPVHTCLQLLFTTPCFISSMMPVLSTSVWTPRSRFPA